MTKLIWDLAFKRKYKKLIKQIPEIKSLFLSQIEILVENPMDKRLKSHKLSGKLKGYWAFSINYTYRVIFRFTDDNEILLIDFGTHDEVY
jgi:addiction module RelE/StbE family toxin